MKPRNAQSPFQHIFTHFGSLTRFEIARGIRSAGREFFKMMLTHMVIILCLGALSVTLGLYLTRWVSNEVAAGLVTLALFFGGVLLLLLQRLQVGRQSRSVQVVSAAPIENDISEQIQIIRESLNPLTQARQAVRSRPLLAMAGGIVFGVCLGIKRNSASAHRYP